MLLYLSKFHLLSGSNEVKFKPSTFTCNKVTFLANFSTFTLLLSVATSHVTSTPRRRPWRFYYKTRILLQWGRHRTVIRSVTVKQLPQHECWILDTAERRPCNGNGVQSRNGPIPGTALHDTLWVALDLIATLELLARTALTWHTVFQFYVDYWTKMINEQFRFVWSGKTVQ